MGYGLKLLALFSFVSFLYVAGIFLFTRGFLLKRLVINEYSQCKETPNLLWDIQYSGDADGCWLKRRYEKAVILIIGILGAIGNGISQPLLCIVFGDLIDSMGWASQTRMGRTRWQLVVTRTFGGTVTIDLQ